MQSARQAGLEIKQLLCANLTQIEARTHSHGDTDSKALRALVSFLRECGLNKTLWTFALTFCTYLRLLAFVCVSVSSLLSFIFVPLMRIWSSKPGSVPGWLLLISTGISPPPHN